MKIAVTSAGKTPDSPIDPRFGRAKYIIVYDTDSRRTEAVINEINMNAPQGAGVQTAKKIAECGADAVISSHVGPRAYSLLVSQGIKVYLAENISVKEALTLLERGQLELASGADVEGHW